MAHGFPKGNSNASSYCKFMEGKGSASSFRLVGRV